MSEPPGTETVFAPTVKILLVSQSKADHAALCAILQDAKATTEAHFGWMIYPVSSLASMADVLAKQEIPIVISESDCLPGSWRSILEYISLLPDPPLLIVASRLADERLWAEALNLGAWDVLAEPFDTQEVIRVLASAWRHWQHRRALPSQPDPTAAGLMSPANAFATER